MQAQPVRVAKRYKAQNSDEPGCPLLKQADIEEPYSYAAQPFHFAKKY